MNDLNGKQRVLQTLQSGKWISTPVLSNMVQLQDNTTQKWLHKLRVEDGVAIESRKVDGKQYNEYRLIGRDTLSVSVTETSTVPLAVEAIRSNEPARPNFLYSDEELLIAQIKGALLTIPEEHIEHKKGLLQIEQIRNKRKCAA